MSESATIEMLARQVRQLRAIAILLSAALAVLATGAFHGPSAQRARYTEIDAERLNVVTPSGRYSVVIATPDRMPGNVIGGKEHPNGRRGGGLLFYNADGDEAGGLLFDSEKKDTGVTAFGQLSVDRFGSDQVAALRYVEDADGWIAGLQVSHFYRDVLLEWHAARDSILALPPTVRDSAMASLRRRFFRAGKWEVPRLFVGERGRTALLRMNDTRGRERVRLIVDSLDVSRLEFLDDSGRVAYRIPPLR